MTQKECKKIIMGKHPDIKLPKLPEVIFSYAKFFYQYLFTTRFYEIENISFSSHIREMDSFLEENHQR